MTDLKRIKLLFKAKTQPATAAREEMNGKIRK
jgi:hypothetical protein